MYFIIIQNKRDESIYLPTVSTLVELVAVLLVWVHLQPVLLGAAGVLRRGSSGEG